MEKYSIVHSVLWYKDYSTRIYVRNRLCCSKLKVISSHLREHSGILYCILPISFSQMPSGSKGDGAAQVCWLVCVCVRECVRA